MRYLVLAPALWAFAASAQTDDSLDALNEALAASENLAVAASQSADPSVASAARQAHFAFLQAAAAFRSAPYRVPTLMDPTTFGIFVKELDKGDKLTSDRLTLITRSSARHLFTVEQVITLM